MNNIGFIRVLLLSYYFGGFNRLKKLVFDTTSSTLRNTTKLIIVHYKLGHYILRANVSFENVFFLFIYYIIYIHPTLYILLIMYLRPTIDEY